MESLQAQLAGCRAQLEHWQGVATICELSKQEELGELQKQCDQEMQSLQEALRGQREILSVTRRCSQRWKIPFLHTSVSLPLYRWGGPPLSCEKGRSIPSIHHAFPMVAMVKSIALDGE